MANETPKMSKFIKPVRISYKNLSAVPAAMEAANQIDVWHKFILFNVGKTDKELILNDLITICTPTLFLPVMYKMETENKATFLAVCRWNSIQKFLNKKMQVKLPSGKIINYDIVLSFLPYKDMQLDIQLCITNLIKSRMGRETTTRKSFNLTNFSNDHRLGSIYCPIHLPIVFDHILRFSQSMSNQNLINRESKLSVRDLILRNNKLESLISCDKIFNYSLSKVDLRDNNLQDVCLLKPFSENKITEIWLDGNPLCNKYLTPKDYTTAVKSILPSIQIIDGVCIGQEKKILPAFNKHFVCDRDKTSLVKQFIEHFFTCYDQNDRIVLNGLYDAGALFSMTVGPISNLQLQLIQPFASNRNLLKFVDYARTTENLLYGPEKIIALLRREPPTIHKIKYLDIDMIYSTNNCFCVCVQGPYAYRKNDSPIMWFHRTLIVVAKEDNEFCIINDQYHIDKCPASLNDVDFSDLKIDPENITPLFNPISFSPAEKYQLLKLMQELTTLNTETSEKYLLGAKWDVRLAIKNFMQSYNKNKIPSDAFRYCNS